MDASEISARISIQELANRYTDAILRADSKAYGDCWSIAGRWHIMGNLLEGREAIVAFYESLTGQILHIRHVAHNPILRIDGDHASGRWQVTETACQPDGAGSMILGVYDDTYACESGVWRFTERKLDIIYHGPFAFDKECFSALDVTDHPF